MHQLAKVLLIIALNHGAATLDSWSTRQLVLRYPGGCEADPLARPFVHSAALYLASQPDAFLADYLLLKHARTKTRKAVFTSFGFGITGLHLGAAAHNLALLGEVQTLPAQGQAASTSSTGETSLQKAGAGGVR